MSETTRNTLDLQFEKLQRDLLSKSIMRPTIATSLDGHHAHADVTFDFGDSSSLDWVGYRTAVWERLRLLQAALDVALTAAPTPSGSIGDDE